MGVTWAAVPEDCCWYCHLFGSPLSGICDNDTENTCTFTVTNITD